MELGVIVDIREDTDINEAFLIARDAGFLRGQVNSFIHGISAEEVRQIAVAARSAKFTVDAVGCYINPLRLADSSLESADITDWKTLVENMAMMNGVERIVCWSGTLGKTLGTPNLLNNEEETFNNLFVTLHGMLEQVRGLPVQIILEPFTAHVLSDARSCLRLVRQFPMGEVRVVLDAPNLIPHKAFAQRDARVQELVAELAPAVGLVHLKDMAIGEDGHRTFPPAGSGALDYSAYLRAIATHAPAVPVILKMVHDYGEMVAAREFVEDLLEENGL